MITQKYITTANLKKMNTVKITKMYFRLFGEIKTDIDSAERNAMIIRIAVWMDKQAAIIISALAGVVYDGEKQAVDAYFELYEGLKRSFTESIREQKFTVMGALTGYRFDMVKKLIDATKWAGRKGQLTNKEIAAMMSTEDRPVTAKDVSNIRQGQVSGTKLKAAPKKKAVKSIDPAETGLVVTQETKIPVGYYGDLGLIEYTPEQAAAIRSV